MEGYGLLILLAVLGVVVGLLMRKIPSRKVQPPPVIVNRPAVLMLYAEYDDEAKAWSEEDKVIYEGVYKDFTIEGFSSIEALKSLLAERKYDLLHLLVRVDECGELDDPEGDMIKLAEIVALTAEKHVSYILLAAENKQECYLAATDHGMAPSANLVMTIERRKENFPTFMGTLFRLICKGETMPMAWNKLAPQIEGKDHKDAPCCMLSVGAANVILMEVQPYQRKSKK